MGGAFGASGFGAGLTEAQDVGGSPRVDPAEGHALGVGPVVRFLAGTAGGPKGEPLDVQGGARAAKGTALMGLNLKWATGHVSS